MGGSLAKEDSLAALIARHLAMPPNYPADRFSGRGIVICAGGAAMFTNAFVLIKVLRQTLESLMPIELWHFGAEEMSASMARLLAELDVHLVDALPRLNQAGADLKDGWQLKAFAIRNSGFEQVLLLDADQVPVRDPAECFDWQPYLDTGAVFWPDIVDIAVDNPVWAACGLAPRRAVSFESGQILVDKRRHWAALGLVEALNERADILYKMIYGDKDTFLISWEVTGATHALVPHRPFADDRCMVQRDFDGKPVFQHRTNCKWSYAGEQHVIEGFVYLEPCLAALAELRRNWGGRVFNAPDRSISARRAESEVTAFGRHTLETLADESFVLELLADGEIGEGRSWDRVNWWCEEGEAGIQLFIASSDRVSLSLRRIEAGDWEGTWLRVPEHPVRLVSLCPPAPKREMAAGLLDELLRSTGFPQMTTDALRDLQGAIAILARVEPGLRARLDALALATPDLYAPLLGRLDPPLGDAENYRDTSTLRKFYRPFHYVGD